MQRGKVKWFNPTKGFGFILPDAGGPDLFVHISEVKKSGLDTLDKEQIVSFEISNHDGKRVATNLKLI